MTMSTVRMPVAERIDVVPGGYRVQFPYPLEAEEAELVTRRLWEDNTTFQWSADHISLTFIGDDVRWYSNARYMFRPHVRETGIIRLWSSPAVDGYWAIVELVGVSDRDLVNAAANGLRRYLGPDVKVTRTNGSGELRLAPVSRSWMTWDEWAKSLSRAGLAATIAR